MTPPTLSQHNRRVMKLNLNHFVQGTGFFIFACSVITVLDLLRLVLTNSTKNRLHSNFCLVVDTDRVVIIYCNIIVKNYTNKMDRF